MRLAGGLLLIALALHAQQEPPIGVVRGSLLECDDRQPEGEFSIRTAANQVYRFRYDAKTYIEYLKERIPAVKMRKGDNLEIVADTWPGSSSLRYARTIHVLEPPAAPRSAVTLGRYRSYRSALEPFLPTGNLTFSGVVRRISPDWVMLHTRLDGEKMILLRQDTRFLDNGSEVEHSALKPNTRVYIRAGRNLDNDIEAYQVIWGRILEPDGGN